MPFGDGTGPNGIGQMTGRGAGFCAGYGAAGYANPGFGRGYGRGFYGRGRGGGRGFGRRNRFWINPGYAASPAAFGPMPAELNTEQELAMLKQQAKDVQYSMQEINKRIEEIEAEKNKS